MAPAPIAASAVHRYDAEILEESLHVEIRSVRDARVNFRRRLRINTPRGVDRYGSVHVLYGPDVKIKSLMGVVRAPDGRRTAIRRGDVFDGSAFESYALYSDLRHRTFSYRGLVPGSTVEHEYELRVRNLHYLEDTFLLQDVIPIRKKTLTIRAPVGFPLRITQKGSPPERSEHLDGDVVVRRWWVRDVPAFEPAPQSPPVQDLLPRLHLEPEEISWGEHLVDSSSWSGVAAFYHELAKDRMEPDPEVEAKSRELTAEAVDDEDAIRRIFEFVRSKVNYISVSLDIGGWQPHEDGEVLRHLYGDCKDQTTLMVAMLRSLGLEGFPALLLTRDSGRLNLNNPSLGFNHAIVAVPEGEDGYRFMDPTAESTPFGDLPWQDQGVMALVVRRDGRGELVETPLVAAHHNLRRASFEGRVRPGGDLRGILNLEVNGPRRAELLWMARDDARKLEDRLTNFVAGVVPGALVTAPALEVPEGWEDPVRVTAGITVPRYLSSAGSIEIVPVSPIRLRDLSSLASESERSLPVFFDLPFSEEIESLVWLPDGRTPARLPEGGTVDQPLFKSRISIESVREDGRRGLLMRRNVSVEKREYAGEDYERLRRFIVGLNEEDSHAVSLQTDVSASL